MLHSIFPRQFLTAARCFAFLLVVIALGGCAIKVQVKEIFQNHMIVATAVVEVVEDVEYEIYESEDHSRVVYLHSNLRKLDGFEKELYLACRALQKIRTQCTGQLFDPESLFGFQIKTLSARDFCEQETARIEKMLLEIAPEAQVYLDKARKATALHNGNKARKERKYGESNLCVKVDQRVTH